ncbi:hypothetical protein Tco_1222934, partial [Tanacetum coccineum]
SSAKKSLGDQEDASKQGRNEIDQDEGILWFQEDSETQGRYGHDIGVNTASTSITTAKPVTTASALITTVGVSVSTVEPSTPPTITTTTVIEDEDLTIAQTLMKMRSEKLKEKSKEKGVSRETATRLARGVIVKEATELDEEVRLEREREEASKAANIAEWDDVQAMMDVDYELAVKLQTEEQGEISIEERSKLFVKLMNERKKHFARLRAEKQRRNPLTKAQQRNQMSNYLKNMARYTLQPLIGYSFDEINTLFETTMRKVNTFVPIESEVDRAVPELTVGSSKRAAEEELDQESSKRQNTGESSEPAEELRDKEVDELSQKELQQMMIIVSEQGINVEALQTKYPIIDWEDLVMLWSLVKEKFNSTEPTDDKEREIWVELKRLFEPDIDDELRKLQKHIHDFTWKLYDSCGVHHVSTGTLTLMLVAKLLVDQDNEMYKELPRKIFMQVQSGWDNPKVHAVKGSFADKVDKGLDGNDDGLTNTKKSFVNVVNDVDEGQSMDQAEPRDTCNVADVIKDKNSFADVVSSMKPTAKVNFRTLFNDVTAEDSDFVLPIETINVVKHRYKNSIVGYFIGKRVAFTLVKSYVTNT